MEYDLIPETIIDSLYKRGMRKEDIENSTPEYLFEEYLNWLGFTGYGKQFIRDIDTLRKAKKAI